MSWAHIKQLDKQGLLHVLSKHAPIEQIDEYRLREVVGKIKYDDILKSLVISSDYETLGHFVTPLSKTERGSVIEFLDHNILNEAKDQKMVSFLLDHGLDLNKITRINEENKERVLEHILTNTLKVPMNPNGINFLNGFPLWIALLGNAKRSYNLEFMKYKGPNFSEPLNINAQSKLGYTYLHMVPYISEKILELEPDHTIKTNSGISILDYQKSMGRDVSLLEAYIDLRTNYNELKKTRAELAECKKKLEMVTNLVSSP